MYTLEPMGVEIMQTVLRGRRVHLQQMATKAWRRAWRTATSFRTEVIRSIGVWQNVTIGVVQCSHPLSIQRRKSHWLRVSPPARIARKVVATLTKRRPERLESDLTPRDVRARAV